MLLGLVHPDAGNAGFDGTEYGDLEHPSGHVGAVLEDASFHPGRTGRNHLRILAAAGDHPRSRVEEVLELTGIADAGNRRVKGYSMGMRQRLAIAAALLGDPEVLILDEPANGLDPPGIRWMRDLLRSEAGKGRAVLVSSHLLSEVSQSVDDIVVISKGELRASGPIDQVVAGAEGGAIRVRAPDAKGLAGALDAAGIAHREDPSGARARERIHRRGRRRGGQREAGRALGADRGLALARGRLHGAHRRGRAGGGGEGVSALLRSELIKLRTTRTFYALAGVTIALAIVFVTLSAILSDPTEETVVSDVFLSDPTSLFILILAIVGITGEWRHRTITSSLLAAPLRVRFLAAKLLAFAAAGALLSLAVSVAVGVIGMVILEIRDQPTPEVGELVEQFARNVGVAALLGALGVCIGGLIRNQPTAIVFVLIMGFVVDTTVGYLAPAVERFSPTGALPNAVQGLSPDDAGVPDVDFFAAVPALGLELVWIAVLFAGGAALLRARDVE